MQKTGCGWTHLARLIELIYLNRCRSRHKQLVRRSVRAAILLNMFRYIFYSRVFFPNVDNQIKKVSSKSCGKWLPASITGSGTPLSHGRAGTLTGSLNQPEKTFRFLTATSNQRRFGPNRPAAADIQGNGGNMIFW